MTVMGELKRQFDNPCFCIRNSCFILVCLKAFERYNVFAQLDPSLGL